MDEKQKEVKMVRMHDIFLHHLQKIFAKHEDFKTVTVGEIDAFERDVQVHFKNFLHTLEDLDCKADVTWIGDNDNKKEGLGC